MGIAHASRRRAAGARPGTPRESAGLLLTSLGLLVLMAIGLGFDRGYGVQLLVGLLAVACLVSYRAGIREGELREQMRHLSTEFEARKRRLRELDPHAPAGRATVPPRSATG